MQSEFFVEQLHGPKGNCSFDISFKLTFVITLHGLRFLGAIIYNSYISYLAKDEVIANIVHRMRPFSVTGETKQQARSSGR